MSKITFKFVYYNAKLDLIGIPVSINGIFLIDTGMPNGYRPLTASWEQVGFLWKK